MKRFTSFCIVPAVAAYLCSCSSDKALLGESGTGGTLNSGGGASAGGVAGGASNTGGTATAGGAVQEGGAGGSGGSAAATALSLSAACAAICAITTQLNCVNASWCASSCAAYPEMGVQYPQQEYLDMMNCIVQNLTSVSDYVCAAPASANQWSPKANTVCESLVCTWTCDDATFVDANVYARCLCT